MKCNNCGAYDRYYTKDDTSIDGEYRKVITYTICSECNYEIRRETNYYRINYPKDRPGDKSW